MTTLHLIREGLASGLLTKKEVIDWADKIVTKDEQPGIFFIEPGCQIQKAQKKYSTISMTTLIFGLAREVEHLRSLK